ncbi:MAG TPA: CoA ester lyase [Rhizomicrobium sp.]|jgi:citrate lyase subunit beta/citryl-CoA lyase|nr:CoA ester lyase [Rhizomicrobium sp.]HWA12910.1 CoA ester lyase [Burkholderiales bacterium]
MILRSLLFVPADSEKKLAKAKSSPADALILDLEDSVAAENRPRAREMAREFLKAAHKQAIWVRINPLGSPDFIRDIEAVTASRPAGFVVPKPDGPQSLHVIDAHLITRETHAGIAHGAIKLLPVATETPAAAMSLQDYRSPPPRLAAMTWGAEDLSAALGATGNRDESGEFLLTYRIVRSLCLIAAKAAGVPAIETLHADFRDAKGLERAARAAQREGFSGMLAIHPDQVAVINDAFTPSASDVEHAKRVVAAFASGAGVASLDGKMLDQPHLKQAKSVLAMDVAIKNRPSP